ncbi:MAG: metallophosphoesterase [Anaerovoracaceae bacterium]
MKILVISDTHGTLGTIYEVYRKLEDIDMIIHLGDFDKDAMQLQKRLDIDVVWVKGNCDGAMIKEDSEKIIETEAGNILITHGHTYGVNYDITNLLYRCEELGCKAVFFGHTHIAYYEEANGIKLLNPGSLTKPRDGSQGTYAIVEATEKGIEGTILYYKKELPKPEGGYIRGLINYSDRF